MKRTILTILVLFLFGVKTILTAQTDKTNLSDHFIEVTGTAETLITPNEFTFKITLRERFDNKEKITIEKQEENLKQELASIGIDVQKDLTVSDINSVFTTQKRRKDVLGNKDYFLKIMDLSKMEKLQQIADKLDLGRLDLFQVTHRDLARFRKETKIAALKAAKEKAEYLLEAIGEKIGKPLQIQETIDYSDYQSSLSNMQRGELSSNSMMVMQDALKTGETLSFTKIKLKYNIVARFEIK